MNEPHNTTSLVELDDITSSIRVLSVYPFIFACIAMASAVYFQSSIAWALSILLSVICIVTLFSRGAILFDPDAHTVIRYRKWLWFESRKITPLSEFESLELTGLACNENAPPSLCLQLRKRDTWHLSSQHIRLRTFDYTQYDEATQAGLRLSGLLGLPFKHSKR